MKHWITIVLLVVLGQKVRAQTAEVVLEEMSSAWVKVPNPIPTRPAVVALARPESGTKPPPVSNTRPVVDRTGVIGNSVKKEPVLPVNKNPELPKATETFDRTNSKVGRFKKAKG